MNQLKDLMELHEEIMDIFQEAIESETEEVSESLKNSSSENYTIEEQQIKLK